MRRQGHSCDQCRKSKRACDAPALEGSQDIEWALSGEFRQVPKTQPCSYCARTKKECTINWAWTQMRIRRALEAESCQSLHADELSPPKRRRLDLMDGQFLAPPLSPDYSLGLTDFVTRGPPEADNYGYDIPAGGLQASATLAATAEVFPVDHQIENSLFLTEWEDIAGHSVHGTQPDLSGTDNFEANGTNESPGSTFSSSFDFPNEIQGQLHWGMDAASWSDVTDSPVTQPSLDPLTISVERAHTSGRATLKRCRALEPRQREQHISYSPFTLNHRVTAKTNETLISSNLLRIYHDVLEHNLSCWLTEVTCPYRPNPVSLQQRVQSAEWGPSWSNRIYHRTLRLEDAAKKAKLVRLSPSEDRACNRALHLAIMAFATQWAQGSRRHHERFCSPPPPPTPSNYGVSEDAFEGLANEFDREIQWHFWTQAEKSLQEMTDVESFRLVCAETILGLVQKPWKSENEVAGSTETETCQPRRRRFDREKLMLKVSQAISQDGPPKYMERAARRMHTLKFKFDSAMRVVPPSFHSHGTRNPVQSMSEDDQTSVGLLYWLAVMFDTVSSSMNHRPLVVSDQDCQHQDCPGEEMDNPRWKVDLFVQDQLDSPAQRTRWPCTYEEVAEAVTRSGPVKVLLYRHVAWLQNTLRRDQKGEKVEEIIRSAMSLYRYWNMTYGELFRDLVQNFACVPGRIQSWFVCISGHWHLASMLLADLIETVDNQELGIKENMQQRMSGRIVARLQETSAKELSDLARVATPSHVDGTGLFAEPQLPDFHPSVNEGTILTEPWTVILIHAFSKATILLLADADDYRQFALTAIGGRGLEETIQRAQDCIQGLWFLGKKSDMARKVADILARELSFHQDATNLFQRHAFG